MFVFRNYINTFYNSLVPELCFGFTSDICMETNGNFISSFQKPLLNWKFKIFGVIFRTSCTIISDLKSIWCNGKIFHSFFLAQIILCICYQKVNKIHIECNNYFMNVLTAIYTGLKLCRWVLQSAGVFAIMSFAKRILLS